MSSRADDMKAFYEARIRDLEAEVERLKAKAALAEEIRASADAGVWRESDAGVEWMRRYDANEKAASCG